MPRAGGNIKPLPGRSDRGCVFLRRRRSRGHGPKRPYERARTGLEEAVTRFLSDRGFPEVRLVARTLDPAAIGR